MRDPQRIPKVMDGIQKIWEARPDLRFGQIFYLLQSKYNELYPGAVQPQIFFIEDDKWQKVIESILEEEVTYIHPISTKQNM